jgi:type IV pilus assembly protein PilV
MLLFGVKPSVIFEEIFIDKYLKSNRIRSVVYSQKTGSMGPDDIMKKKNGFSLMEVLIGVLLLAIGLLAIGGLQVTSVRGSFNSNNLMQATYVAQDRLEFLRNLPFTSPLMRPDKHDDGNSPIAGIVYSREYVITDNVTKDLKTIDYTVRWNDGSEHRIDFSTRRSQ